MSEFESVKGDKKWNRIPEEINHIPEDLVYVLWK